MGSGADGEAKFEGMLDTTALYTTAFSAKHVLALAYAMEPTPNMTLPTDREVLATRPIVVTTVATTAAVTTADTRILGMAPVTFAILCGCVILLIALAVLLSLRFNNRPKKWQEEDHP